MLERMRRRLPLRLSIPLMLIGLWGLIWPPDDPKTLIAVAAAVIAGLAWLESSRSADASSKSASIAADNEERRKYGWTITLHANGDHYLLRNTGTLAASDVRFGDEDKPLRARFALHDSSDEGPTIQPGQAKTFFAYPTYSDPIMEMQIDWLPEGETQRQTFTEHLPPKSSAAFEQAIRERSEANAAEALVSERATAEARRLLIDLIPAWSDYQENPNAHNKSRVQGIDGALPTHFAKEVGHAVDVPRDHWSPNQYPLEAFAGNAEDVELVHRDKALIELIWNLWLVQLPPMVGADLSQPPHYWHRIEHAINGYIEMVRNRESGRIELKEGSRDRKQTEHAQQMFKQVEGLMRKPGTSGTPPGSGG